MKNLIVLFLMAMSFSSSYAYSFSLDGIYYAVKHNGHGDGMFERILYLTVVSEYDKTVKDFPTDTYTGEIVIPMQLFYDYITPGSDFYYTIPDVDYNIYLMYIIEIGAFAFYNCDVTYVSIPDYVENIYKEAFSHCSKLKEVSIGSGLKSIVADAFNNCPKLTSIKLNCTTPPRVVYEDEKFDDLLLSQCTLYVPLGCKATYERDSNWQVFQNIEEYDFSESSQRESSNQNVSQSK